MLNPWGGVGAWALDAERAEEEERLAAVAIGPAGSDAVNSQSFPSLKEAANIKSKKKKPVAITLAEFNSGAQPTRGRSSASSTGLTPEEMIRLPTGPRERSAEEIEASRLGGGFRSYGYGGGGGDGGSFDKEPRWPSRVSDFDQPSREEAVDNWAAGKKSVASPLDCGRQDRYGLLGGGASSRADEVDSWSSGKKSLPVRQPETYSLGGFNEAARPTESVRWVREGPLPLISRNGERERKELVLDPPMGRTLSVEVVPAKPRESPFCAARPREEVLAEKGLDLKRLELDNDMRKTAREGSEAVGVEGSPKLPHKVNPFGDAKPREIFLQEQGKDWRKIDLELEHGRVDRHETPQEELLKNKIDQLNNVLFSEAPENLHGESTQSSAEERSRLLEQVHQMEKDLERLIHDDRIRFGQKSSEGSRPGSGAGRVNVAPDGPPSSVAGLGNILVEPVEWRYGFRGGRERNTLENRNVDRPSSRERW